MTPGDAIHAWLDTALAQGQLRALDRAFALFLRTLDPGADDRVIAAAALASFELGNGHIGVDMRDLLADLAIDHDRALVLPMRPEPSEWLAALARSPPSFTRRSTRRLLPTRPRQRRSRTSRGGSW